MEDTIELSLSIEETAARAGVSKRRMERLFQERLKRSSSRPYLETKMKKVPLLLERTTDSVLNIALQCGLAKASYFSKRYHDVFHESPSDTHTRSSKDRASEMA